MRFKPRVKIICVFLVKQKTVSDFFVFQQNTLRYTQTLMIAGSITFCFQDSEMEESSNLNAPATPSMSDVDDGEEVVSFRILLTSAYVTVIL